MSRSRRGDRPRITRWLSRTARVISRRSRTGGEEFYDKNFKGKLQSWPSSVQLLVQPLSAIGRDRDRKERERDSWR